MAKFEKIYKLVSSGLCRNCQLTQFSKHVMKNRLIILFALFLCVTWLCAEETFVEPTHAVELSQAHEGTLEVDTMLLDSYGQPPKNMREFYLRARGILAGDATARISDPRIVAAANDLGIALISGPMLGDLTDDGVTIWL